MNKLTLCFLAIMCVFYQQVYAGEGDRQQNQVGKSMQDMKESLLFIKNFHFVSDQLASSGMLELEDYTLIKDYGFKHVINLIPGDQKAEREHVESLGLSYQQIEVIWKTPTETDFKRFVKLMDSYGNDKVYVHCMLNWRASAFVFLYRVMQLKDDVQLAKKDLLAVWTPEEQWLDFVQMILGRKILF